MSVNKYRPHVFLIPEDDADRQVARGFLNHHAIDTRSAQIMPLADGWPHIPGMLEKEYLPKLRESKNAHVVVIVDFDDKGDGRYDRLIEVVPEEYRDRVFVIGTRKEPETARSELGKSFETIGRELANECDEDKFELWQDEHFQHNEDELKRLVETVKPILFGSH